MRAIGCGIVGLLIVAQIGGARASEPHYKLLKEIPVGGGGGWFYL
jgi:hypothetical protein